jgi:RimJ/RimL family protein N-acetyltransferase
MRHPYRTGEKIYLRPLDRDDIDTLVPWVNDPEVTRTLLIYLPFNRIREEEFISSLYRDPGSVALGIALRAPAVNAGCEFTAEEVQRDLYANHLIGVCGIQQYDDKNRSAGFGIMLGEKRFWNVGYGTEATRLLADYAFDTLNLHRLWLHVHENNPNGRRVYEKVGYQYEGTLRQAHYQGGRYWDVSVMSLLRSDWEKMRAPK